MAQQEGAQIAGMVELFTDFDEQGFDGGTRRMGALTGTMGVRLTVRDHTPVQERKELAVELHHRVVLEHALKSRLVKGRRKGYDRHSRKLLVGKVDNS